mmetsp:Transcript_43575/g.86465  ORF Transcript_43575/g.86465 Transcript_43575/m.86465 type:complete len:559 (+) Transcript_43575:128-1804(+)
MAESWRMHNEGSVARDPHAATDASFKPVMAWQSAGQQYSYNNLERPAAFMKDEDDSSLPCFPRIVTAMELLEESDDESTFCGPQSDSDDAGLTDFRALEAWGISLGADDDKATGPDGRSKGDGRGADGGGAARDRRQPREPKQQPGGDGADSRQPREQTDPPPQQRRPPPLVAPRGEIIGDNQKFICVFQIGLEDNEEFCLVKRILGKAGNNMRRIAEECSAKVRLRGIGSGFLEGADGKEANMPLQLNVSCTDYDSYLGAVGRVSTLLKDLYKHYRRYARSKGMEPPDVKINLEEVRRDDLNLDLLSQKAQRSPSQRERDRRARERERQQLRERERERERERGACTPASAGAPTRDGLGASELAGKNEHTVDNASIADSDGTRPLSDGEGEAEKDGGGSKGKTPLLLPGGMQVPTTPAGRRAAARAGGAAAAAIASAAAREADRVERERLRDERNRQREQEREERDQRRREAAAAASSRNGRNNARGKAKAGQHPVGSAPDRAYPGPQEGKGKSSYGNHSTKGKGKGKGYAHANKGGPPPPPPGPPPDDAVQYSPPQ